MADVSHQIRLSSETERFVRAMVDSGRFASVDELIETALQNAAQRERERRWLNDQIQTGIDSADTDELIDGETFFAQLLGEAYVPPTEP